MLCSSPLLFKIKHHRLLLVGEFTYVRVTFTMFSYCVRTLRLVESFTGIQDERVSPHIYDKRLNARARCADTNPLLRRLQRLTPLVIPLER